jgi:hypothetical protein
MYGNIFTNSTSKINFTSADEMGRKMVKITGTQRPGREPDARLCCIAYVFHDRILIYPYLSIIQIKHFRPGPIHCTTENLFFWLSVNIFIRSALDGEGGFLRGPNPVSATLKFANPISVQSKNFLLPTVQDIFRKYLYCDLPWTRSSSSIPLQSTSLKFSLT